MKIEVKNGQSLLDIALQYGGTVEAVFDIARVNDISITATLTSEQTLDVSAPYNAVVNYYRQNNIVPATGLNGDGNSGDKVEEDYYVDECYVEINYISYE